MKFIFIGDYHWTDKEPYFTGLKKLSKYIIDNYKNDIVFFSGDFWDKNTPNWEKAYSEGLDLLLSLNNVHLINGNHELGTKGNLLAPLKNKFKNLSIYTEKTELEIEGYKFLMLPFLYDRKKMDSEYKNLTGEYDFVFNHVSPIGSNYGQEEFDFNLLNVSQAIIYGHIHTKKQFVAGNNQHYVLGVPQPTKSGEDSIKSILEFDIDTKQFTEIDLPCYFDILNLDYQKIDINTLNKDFLYNVYNAPSIIDVENKLKGFYINTINLLHKTTAKESNNTMQTFNNKLEDTFLEYCKEMSVNPEVMETCLRYITTNQ